MQYAFHRNFCTWRTRIRQPAVEQRLDEVNDHGNAVGDPEERSRGKDAELPHVWPELLLVLLGEYSEVDAYLRVGQATDNMMRE
jgi:hypothetical protein